MWGWAPIVVPMATAFVLAGDCGGGVGFVSWNAAGTEGGWVGYVQTPTGASAYRLAPTLGRSSFVLERYQTSPGGGSWAAVTCNGSPLSPVRCPRDDELRMPDGWSLSCERRAGQEGICVCDPK